MNDDGDLALLVDGAAACGILLDQAQLAAFARYRELLLDWNTRVNLTAITDPQEIITRHFLDSLTCLLAVSKERWGASSQAHRYRFRRWFPWPAAGNCLPKLAGDPSRGYW